jgi:uncharacterized protein YukE
MGALASVIPVVGTVIDDIVKAIDSKKSDAVNKATAKAGTNTTTTTLDASAVKDKQKPGTVVNNAKGVAETTTNDTIGLMEDTVKATGQEASKIPNTGKSYSEAQLELSKEWQVVVTFVGTCFEAEDNVIRMQTLLEAKSGAPLNPSDKRHLGESWTRISDAIKTLQDQQTSINDLDNPSTQVTLKNLFDKESVDPDAIDGDVKAVSEQGDQSALADLNQSLSKLKDALHGINVLALTVINDVVHSLADVSKANQPLTTDGSSAEKGQGASAPNTA